CSAFFSASEMAYSSCNSIRLEKLKEEGSKRAGVALRIAEHFDDALSTILIGNNLANIGASSLTSVLVLLLSGSDRLTWLGTLIITVVIIIFGETIPKICAKKSANRISLRHAYVVRLLMFLLGPVVWIVVKLVALLTFPLKGEKDDENAEEAVEELHSIIETAEDEEVLDEDQSELLRSAIEFSEISALDVMTARVDVVAIDIEDDWDEIIAQVEEASFSRLPVYEDSIDNIIGVLYLNRFLKALADGGRVDIRSLLMPPCYVYKTMKLPAVLNQLRRAKQHLAVVTDEYGGTLGVLSMEDVLEQIVEALKKLDFYVVTDTEWNSSCPYADIVLPAATNYETHDQFATKNSKDGTWIGINQKICEPMGESRSDWQIYLDIACAMGYGEDFWNGSVDDALREQLDGSGITLEELREKGSIFVERTDGEYELDGAMMLFEMEELLELPEDSIEAESSTVGGWTLESFGRFPREGDSFTWRDLTVTVLEMSDGRRVEKVLVKRDPAADPDE
ncbi:MAG: HlyC/CorC family transporter, partial [Oscillospiraceae bacterium]|nr:HlyC/CorC family transporter [Oscillospiraceae bacterium]